jgi:uncharacterized protein (UPF0248 family)
MIPIRTLLNRIRWDQDFANGDFQIGYEDRLAGGIVLVPLHQVLPIPGAHFSVRIVDNEGVPHLVPYHRIKEVYRNGALIWKRP